MRKGTDKCNGRCQPKQKCKANQTEPESDSAIGTHVLSCVARGNSYDEVCFPILGRARSAFHLKVLEAVFIETSGSLLC